MQQSVNFASTVPIKKRKFPIIEFESVEKPSVSEDNKQESRISGGDPKISDLDKSSAPVVTDSDGKVSEYKPQEPPEPSVSLAPGGDLGNKADISSAAAEADVLATSVSADGMILKQEIVSGQVEGTSRMEPLADPRNVESAVESNKPVISALKHENHGSLTVASNKSDPLFSLGVSKEKLGLRDENDNSIKDVSREECANRSNWDLNTSMDEWNAKNDPRVDFCGFGTTGSSPYVTSSLSNHDVKSITCAAGSSLDKGKDILNEQSSNSFNTSVCSTQQCKQNDSLGLSLALPSGESELNVKYPSLSEKLGFSDYSPNLNMRNLRSPTVSVNSVSCRAVKLEPLTQHLKGDFSIATGSNTVGLSKFSNVKTEIVEKQRSETIPPLSISSQKLVDFRSIKSELIQEHTNEVSKSEGSEQPQHVERVMQHQESFASSTAMSTPLTPQTSCPSRFSTFTELNVIGGQSKHSVRSEVVHDKSDAANKQTIGMFSKKFSQDNKPSSFKVGDLTVEDSKMLELTKVGGHSSELCGNNAVAANYEEKINRSAEMLEEDTRGSDCGSHENHGVATPIAEGKLSNKEDGEYEEGEVRTPLQHSAIEDPVVDMKKTENTCGSTKLQPCVLPCKQSPNTSDNEKSAISENDDEIRSKYVKQNVTIGRERNSEENSSRRLSENVPEAGIDMEKSISITIEKPLDMSKQQGSGKDAEEEVSSDGPSNGSHGTECAPVKKATDLVVKQICSGKHDFTSSNVEESVYGNVTAKESNAVGNKSRIINLPRASVGPSSCQTRSVPNKFLTSQSGKERYSDVHGDIPSRGHRNDFYTHGANKYGRGRMHDSSGRNSRPSFMRGRGRGSGRFGPVHNEWEFDNDFTSETYNGPSGYRVRRHKHASSIDDVDMGYNRYGIEADGSSMRNSRRKETNSDKFMQHLSGDTTDTVYTRPQTMYDDFDGQVMRGNENFSTMHRKGYPRIQSKSPVRSRARSPGLWSAGRRQSPNGIPELERHRSPPLYRMRRIRSPDGACFRDEMIPRRRGSPPYVPRHSNDLRDVDSVPDHVHPRSVNSNRRSPPARFFQRTANRDDVLDSRERGLGNIDERRKFIERRGPPHPFRPSYNGDSDNFHFHMNDDPRPRFCPDEDIVFVERNNMREREYGGRIKHQPLAVPRRLRDIEEHQDGTYRPGGRVWHDDFNDVSGLKRRRF